MIVKRSAVGEGSQRRHKLIMKTDAQFHPRPGRSVELEDVSGAVGRIPYPTDRAQSVEAGQGSQPGDDPVDLGEADGDAARGRTVGAWPAALFIKRPGAEHLTVLEEYLGAADFSVDIFLDRHSHIAGERGIFTLELIRRVDLADSPTARPRRELDHDRIAERRRRAACACERYAGGASESQELEFVAKDARRGGIDGQVRLGPLFVGVLEDVPKNRVVEQDHPVVRFRAIGEMVAKCSVYRVDVPVHREDEIGEAGRGQEASSLRDDAYPHSGGTQEMRQARLPKVVPALGYEHVEWALALRRRVGHRSILASADYMVPCEENARSKIIAFLRNGYDGAAVNRAFQLSSRRDEARKTYASENDSDHRLARVGEPLESLVGDRCAAHAAPERFDARPNRRCSDPLGERCDEPADGGA